MPVQKPEPLYDEDQGPVLIVCATRDRPGDFLRLARSFHDTSIHAHLMAYVDDDQSAAYQALELPPRVRLHVGKRVGPIQAINWIVHSYRSGYRIYGVAPDDATFLTPGWDDWLRDTIDGLPGRLGIVAAAHDCGEYVNFACVSREWVEVCGWYAYPHAYHFIWDTVLEMLGEATRIVYAPASKFMMHHDQKPTINTEDHYTGDAHSFLMWCVGERRALVHKIREAIETARHGSHAPSCP